jgi:hypothetical protein
MHRSTYPHILHTGKKVRLQIRIDHKMFDIFTSRNVKKNLLISTLASDQNVRPNSRTWRVLTQICRTFWEEYVGPESMIVDTLGVYCMLIFRHIFLSNYWWIWVNTLQVQLFGRTFWSDVRVDIKRFFLHFSRWICQTFCDRCVFVSVLSFRCVECAGT